MSDSVEGQLSSMSILDASNTPTIAESSPNATSTDLPYSTFHRFMDLPPELREKVYEHALTYGRPIEMAPLHAEAMQSWHGYWKYPYILSTGETYHTHRYKTDVLRRLDLLRVSRLVSKEATPLFYGQAFRFTSEVGWLILGIWLTKIGPTKRSMVKNITVGHPGLSENIVERSFHYPPAHLENLFELSPLRLTLPACDREYQVQHEEALEIMDQMSRTTLKMLSGMSQLKQLELVIVATQYPADFNLLANQDVLQAPWAAGLDNLEMSVISLASMQPNGVPKLYELPHFLLLGKSQIPWPEIEAHDYRYCQDAAAYFIEVKERGHEIKDVEYDNHMTYPKTPNTNYCSDHEICTYLAHGPDPAMDYRCKRSWPRSTDEQSGLEDLERRLRARESVKTAEDEEREKKIDFDEHGPYMAACAEQVVAQFGVNGRSDFHKEHGLDVHLLGRYWDCVLLESECYYRPFERLQDGRIIASDSRAYHGQLTRSHGDLARALSDLIVQDVDTKYERDYATIEEWPYENENEICQGEPWEE